MPNVEKGMLMFGRIYEWLCKIPLVGVPVVKAWTRGMASLIFRAPEPGGKPKDSIMGVKDYLLWSGKEMNFPFEIIEESVGPDSFEFYLKPFRYGMPPHAGWGLGMERLIMTMLDLPNIREAVLFPRDRHRLTP